MSELQKLVDWYSGEAENLTMQYTARLAKKELKALQTRLQAIEQAARQLVYQISIDGEVQAACKDVVALLDGDK